MSSTIDRLNEGLSERYLVQEEVARGGMATVYRARDLRHDRVVALKVLRSELTRVVNEERFLAEIKTTAGLIHPNILPLYDSGRVDAFLFFVTPFIEGETLRERLERQPQLPLDEVVRIVSEVADAIAYAHRQGVVHRDIKPGNILLHEGRALVADFGIALSLDRVAGERITETGVGVGSPEYMSPEQAAGESDIDHRSDVYSLGCVVHEMLAGEPVFTGSTTRALAAKHMAVAPTPLRALRSGVPPGVEAAILRCLEKTPVDRFPSVEEFAEELERAVREGTRGTAFGAREGEAAGLRGLGGRDRPLPLAGLAAVGGVVVVLLLGLLAWGRYLDRSPAEIRLASAIVLPFGEPSSTVEERALAVDVADAVERELRGWDGIQVATSLDLAGPRAAMGLEEPTLDRTEDGLMLARQTDVEGIVSVTTRIRGDSIQVRAAIIEARTGRRAEESVSTVGPADELPARSVVAPIVARVLGFGDADRPERALGAGTRDPAAAARYLAGLESLGRARLDQAEGSFREAIGIDSTFASALTYLGQTLFWRAKESPGGLDRLGPEVTRWSTAAMRHLDGLSAIPGSHVRGFFAFQRGDYEQARVTYGSIVEADSTDVNALLILSQIELYDRWMVPDDDGRMVPRSSLASARRALTRVLETDPTYELAYGQVFELQSMVEASVTGGVCSAFDLPVAEMVPLWQTWTPSATTRAFCPVALDSLLWLEREAFDAEDRDRFRAGANLLFQQAVGELERWASIAPDRPRPFEMLSEALLSERPRLGAVAPARHREVAAEALGYLERAVELRGGAEPVDLVNLANLNLAAGNENRAVELARQALETYEERGSDSGSRPPIGIVNVLARAGQGGAALEIASTYGGEQLVQDPETGELLSLAGAEVILNRLRLFAALGIGGEPFRTELGLLRSGWAGAGYSTRQQDLLSTRVAPRIASALATDSASVAEWSAYVASDDPLWRALVRSHDLHSPEGEEHALEALEAAREAIAEPDGAQTFILGRIASRLGRPDEAIRHFNRLDSLPYRVNESFFDGGWGLQVASFLIRAESYEELGDGTAAREMLDRYLRARSWPDSLTAPGVERARSFLARLSEG